MATDIGVGEQLGADQGIPDNDILLRCGDYRASARNEVYIQDIRVVSSGFVDHARLIEGKQIFRCCIYFGIVLKWLVG